MDEELIPVLMALAEFNHKQAKWHYCRHCENTACTWCHMPRRRKCGVYKGPIYQRGIGTIGYNQIQNRQRQGTGEENS